jgi:hypothetical protein
MSLEIDEEEIGNLEGTFSMLLDVQPGLAKTDFIRDLSAPANGTQSNEAAKPEGETQPEGGGKPEGETQPEAGVDEAALATPFFSKAPKKDAEVVSMGTTEEWAKTIGSKFGIDTSAKNWESSFIESTSKWRADSGKVSELESRIKEHDDFLADLPDQLKIPMLALIQGEDWETSLREQASGQINFNKKVEDLPVDLLVKHYIKEEEFTDEDFSAEGMKDPKMKSFVRAAKASFIADKKQHDSKREEVYESVRTKQNAFKNSVEVSVSELKKDLPFFGDKDAEELRSLLDTKSFLKMFFAEDGTLNKQAAKMLAFAKHGDHLLTIAQDKAFAKGVSEKNAGVIKNATKNQSNNGSNQQADSSSNDDILRQIKAGMVDNWGVGSGTY